MPDADWPSVVRAVSTTRLGGVGTGAWSTLGLAAGGGDDDAVVAANRGRLVRRLGLPASPVWLQQVHGTDVVHLGGGADGEARPRADAAWTDRSGPVCAVLTADCLPVVLAADDGAAVAVAHAGWRGLAAGVLERTVDALRLPPDTLHAWLGPAIGPHAFEVGPEVRAAFVDADAATAVAFRRGRGERWFADICALARRRLRMAGVRWITGGGWCTVGQPELFFSHRRDGGLTGRMATLAWIDGAVDRVHRAPRAGSA